MSRFLGPRFSMARIWKRNETPPAPPLTQDLIFELSSTRQFIRLAMTAASNCRVSEGIRVVGRKFIRAQSPAMWGDAMPKRVLSPITQTLNSS
jgi:hypothetical protein